jgi:hypothetical protein
VYKSSYIYQKAYESLTQDNHENKQGKQAWIAANRKDLHFSKIKTNIGGLP